jgi:4-aminobutyrate aminotransferase-like enzyme
MFDEALRGASDYLARVRLLRERYRAGEVHVRVPEGLRQGDRPLEELVRTWLPRSHAALEAARRGLFYSLPVAFDPAESVGCFLATSDRDERGEPYRFLDLGAQIATRAFGENEPWMIEAILRDLPCVVNRYAHSEYQTALSLRLKAALDRIAPPGTPRHFVVNTGAEAVENAIKAVLRNRALGTGQKDGGVIVSFDGAFHGRTLGALAVTHRRKARTGFPTFEWPQVAFPVEEPGAPAASARREERSLRQIFELLSSGRGAGPPRDREAFGRELEAIDAFLARPGVDLQEFLAVRRAALGSELRGGASRVAAVLVEPIQGEGGVRIASARFFRRLRLLTKIYEVALIFDEVQTGFGSTGRLWAHERFDLPFPPDIVTWAKKAQNGVLFVSDELATFFQEEKKFNTTWEGDSTGMVRLLAMIERIDLEQAQQTGAAARERLEALAREYRGLLRNPRGAGVMLAFDLARADVRDLVLDRAFRRGLILLPAGERALRFYPRHDTPPAVLDEAIAILRTAIEDVCDRGAEVTPGPRVRVGDFESPLAGIQVLELEPAAFADLRPAIMAVEIDRYGSLADYPPDVLRAGRRPLLQYPAEALEASVGHPGAIGIALRDGVSERIVAYALGSPLEHHDEEGVADDPHLGERSTFYLQAMATSPSVRNRGEIEGYLLDRLRERVAARGFEYVSTLIEDEIRHNGPAWLRGAEVLHTIENYLRTGKRFVYVQAVLRAPAGASPGPVTGGPPLHASRFEEVAPSAVESWPRASADPA